MTQKFDMASLLVFEPFTHFPAGLKIRVHDEDRLDSLGRSVAVPDEGGGLLVDLDQVITKPVEETATAPAQDSGAELPVKA